MTDKFLSMDKLLFHTLVMSCSTVWVKTLIRRKFTRLCGYYSAISQKQYT